MSKRSIDCAEILCLSKYNMYLEINLHYQCTIISIILLQYKSFNGSTIFFRKKTYQNHFPPNKFQIIYLFLHLLYKICYEYLLMVLLIQIQNTVNVSCFYEKPLGSFYSLKRIQTIIDMEIIFHYFSVISFTCEVFDGILVLCLGNRTLAE